MSESKEETPVGDGPEALDMNVPPLASPFGPKPVVTRVNRKTLAMLGGVGVLLGMMVLVVGLSDHTRTRKASSDQENDLRPSTPAEAVRDLPTDYSFDARHAFDGVGYGSKQPAEARNSPVESRKPTAVELADAARRERLEQMRQQLLEQERKELQLAMDSPLVFASAKSTAPGGTSRAPSGARGPRDADASATPPMPLAPATSVDRHETEPSGEAIEAPDIHANIQREKETFVSQASQVEPYLAKPLIAPLSPYELKAGTIIPGALITGINTDLPGQIIGQVTQNIYDTATGLYLLIPQGAKLLGKYQSEVSNGQNRALVVWQRLIMPNGKSIMLDGMPGADAGGMAGLKDSVDYHTEKLIGAAMLTTGLAYAGNLARDPHADAENGTGNDVVGDTVAQQANRIGEKIIDRDLDVQPTITIRPGWPFRVLVSKDMVLEPYTDAAP